MNLPCGKRVRNLKDNTMRSLSVDDLKRKIQELSSEVKTRNLSRQDACVILDQLQRYKAPLRYDGLNSCYLDSVLVALYFNKIKWLDRHTINNKNVNEKLLNSFTHIVSHIRNPRESSIKCTNFRQLLAQYDPVYNRAFNLEWKRTQQEPLDVIQILERIFGIKESVRLHEHTISSKHGRRLMGSITSYRIPISLLIEKPIWDQVFPSQVDKDTGTHMRFIDAPFLYVHVDRNFNDKKKVRNPLQPPFQVITSKGRILHLVSIIMHLGEDPTHGHYVAMVKTYDDTWLYYDDMNPTMLPIPKNKIFTFQRSRVLRDAVGFIYAP